MKKKAGQDTGIGANQGMGGEMGGEMGGQMGGEDEMGRNAQSGRSGLSDRISQSETGVDSERTRQRTGERPETAADEVEPIGLAEERRRRIEKLRMEAETLGGGRFTGEGIDRLPPEMQEAFWQQIIAYETAEPSDLFELVTRGGVSLPESVLISEEHLSDRLWEVIYFLSSLGCYIENTDHLSDRELYTLLRERLLHEPAILFPDDPNYAYHIDTIGSGSAEDQQLYLTYYATDLDRDLWARSWPDDPLPARIPCPFDRDRLLPRPSSRRFEPLM